jgi:hypothetical protein
MRKSSSVILVMAILLMVMPALAQDTSQWSAYLFDNINNALIRVSSSEETQSFSLGIPSGSYVYGMSISSDGSQVAYCYEYREDPNAAGTMKLVVRDIDQEANLFETELGQLVGCSVTAFNTDVLALSIVYNYAFNAGEGISWELRLIDPTTGEALSALTNETPEMPTVAFFGQEDVPVLAKVHELSRERVSFIAIPYVGSEGPAEMPAYEWNVSEGTVSELPAAFGRFNADYLSETGEVVYSTLDESLDAAMPNGPIPQANVVKIQNAQGDVTIYQNTDWVITGTSFVSNGEAVLVSMIAGFDEQNPEPMNISRYVLVKRDGTIIEFTEEYNGAVFVDAIPNGAIFVYTANPSGPDYAPSHVFLMSNEGVLTPYSDVEVDYSLGWSPPQLVWTSPSPVASDLAPFVGQ